MKRTRNTAALLMALVLAMSVCFSGCGQTPAAPESKTSSQSGASSAAAGTLDTSKEVELIMYVISDKPAKQDEVTDNFNKIAKEKLNCTLKVNYIGWAEYVNKYPLLFSSGEKFDMAYAATWLNYAGLAQKGAFMNLDELWPTYAPKNFALQSETAKRQATVDGHYYCVPTTYSNYDNFGLIYRTDFLKDTEWKGTIENFEDMEAYFDLAKELTDMEPISIYQNGSEIDEIYMKFHGLYPLNGATNEMFWLDPNEENPQIFTYYDYEKTPEFLEMINRWNEKGFFIKSALSDTDSEKVPNGKAASEIHNMGRYRGRYIDNPDAGFQFANFVTDTSTLAYTQDAMVISNTSENPERALALYDLITTDEEAFRAFYYGIEGVSYELNDKDEVTMLDPDNYGQSPLWTARTNDFELGEVGTPDDYYELEEKLKTNYTEGEKSQKFRSFVPITASIETEYAACQNVHQQYWWPLELGYTDPVAGLEEYKAKMEAAGIEKVRETLQAQLDEYVAGLN